MDGPLGSAAPPGYPEPHHIKGRTGACAAQADRLPGPAVPAQVVIGLFLAVLVFAFFVSSCSWKGCGRSSQPSDW